MQFLWMPGPSGERHAFNILMNFFKIHFFAFILMSSVPE